MRCCIKGFALFHKILILWYVWGFYDQYKCTPTYIRRRRRKTIAPRKWGFPPYTFHLFVIYDGRKPEAKIAEILKFQSFENFENMLKARNACIEICFYKWTWMIKSSYTEKEGPLLILSLNFDFVITISNM